LILYVNGDSHSYGYEAGGPEFSYGRYLADAIGAEFVCDAYPGSSNDAIIRRTREYLKNNNPDFVVIGWSTWEREEWELNGQYYNVNSAGHDVLPDELQQRYKEWVINTTAHDYWSNCELVCYHKILDLHRELTERGINHLFFNCYLEIKNDVEHNWDNSYIYPKSKEYTYYFWLEAQGYIPVNKKWHHYGADAHEAWAKFLLPHLTNL
jgi:hypothetical protein